uniref:Chitin-binding type-2 domain-containing protein n=1 Tax=Bactrocera latifrons TaxID=174628 RepID=A0A0K8UZ83_BACLA
MWKHTLLLVCLSGCCLAGPLHGVKRNVPVLREDDAELERPAPEPLAPEYPEMPSTLTLPSNATSIRADITDSFSCDDKVYGYYADVENDCQIFHVCLPVTYADGKESTFRWSFICPEETVFSQESFTCMRREDIAFSCEDSVNYYELNRNFGDTEEQNVNSNNAQANEEQAEAQPAEPAEPAEQEVEQAVAPQAAAPAPQPEKPVKPVKVQKPNRRKPQPKPQQNQAIYPTNKLPSIMPLRKMPNVGPNALVSVPAEVVSVQAAEKDEVKVVPPRYKKRPAVNSEKKGIEEPAQPFKVELVHTVSNPESYKRRRPTFAHKNSVVTKVSEEVPVAVETAPEAVEVAEPIVPAVKFESNLDASPVQAQKEIEAVEEPVAQVAVEFPVAEAETAIVADAEPQASETGEVAVEPEQTLKTIAVQPHVPDTEATQAEEAFVAPIELAQSVVEAEPEYAAPVAEEKIKIEEPMAEELSKSEEAPAEEKIKVEKPIVAQLAVPAEVEPENEALNKEPVAETVEDKPTITGDALQNVATEEKIEEVAAAQQINVETPTQAEEQAQPAQLSENNEDQLAGASEPVALEAEPEVIAPVENAEESLPALPSLEELEEQKPANAVEVMPASPEMEQQDPIVHQAFEGNDAHLQTVGGFKPVDPEMAAEAEALISDFINTLKSAHPNEKPILPESVEEEVPAASAESEDTKIDIIPQTEEKIIEAEAQPEEVPAAAETETNLLKTVAAEEPLVETENVPVVTDNEPVEEEEVKVSPLLKFPISNSFASNMYQIPVTVIQTPYEEVQNAETEVLEPQEHINAEGVKAEAPESVEEAAPAVAETQEQLKFVPEKTEAEIIPAEETEPEVHPAIVEFVEATPEAVQPALPEAMDTVPETKSEAAQPAAPVALRPISIDDIVELVKERLDQAPADEKGAPMELIVDSSNADKPVELKFSLEKGSAPQEVSAEQTPAEDIIFPIYHRVSEPEVSAVQAPEAITAEEPSAFVTELKKLPVEAEAVQEVVEPLAQTADQAVQTNADELEANVAIKSAINTETEQEAEAVPAPVAYAQETESEAAVVSADEPVQTETVEAESAKANRALRSRSLTKAKLDPRKRRFLFRSDAS